MTPAASVVGYLCGVVLVGMFVWIAVALHMAYTKLDVMLEHLQNSSGIIAIAPLRHGGPWGKLMLIGGISGFVTFSSFYAKRGGINTDDVKKFSGPLKRKLAIMQWSGIGLLIFLALVVALYKVLRAYHV